MAKDAHGSFDDGVADRTTYFAPKCRHAAAGARRVDAVREQDDDQVEVGIDPQAGAGEADMAEARFAERLADGSEDLAADPAEALTGRVGGGDAGGAQREGAR